MRKSSKLVRGIGFKGMDYPSKDGKGNTKEYSMWADMLLRCTDTYWAKAPTYIGTTCSENFKFYSFFYEWCNSQIGFGNKDENGRAWSLDKDILVKGNKLYSEDTCCFVPHSLNNLLLNRKNDRGQTPVGVYWDENKRKFRARCFNGTGTGKALGDFKTPEEAFLAYKIFKESHIKQVAEQHKQKIDIRVYQALINYQIEITD